MSEIGGRYNHEAHDVPRHQVTDVRPHQGSELPHPYGADHLRHTDAINLRPEEHPDGRGQNRTDRGQSAATEGDRLTRPGEQATPQERVDGPSPYGVHPWDGGSSTPGGEASGSRRAEAGAQRPAPERDRPPIEVKGDGLKNEPLEVKGERPPVSIRTQGDLHQSVGVGFQAPSQDRERPRFVVDSHGKITDQGDRPATTSAPASAHKGAEQPSTHAVGSPSGSGDSALRDDTRSQVPPQSGGDARFVVTSDGKITDQGDRQATTGAPASAHEGAEQHSTHQPSSVFGFDSGRQEGSQNQPPSGDVKFLDLGLPPLDQKYFERIKGVAAAVSGSSDSGVGSALPRSFEVPGQRYGAPSPYGAPSYLQSLDRPGFRPAEDRVTPPRMPGSESRPGYHDAQGRPQDKPPTPERGRVNSAVRRWLGLDF